MLKLMVRIFVAVCLVSASGGDAWAALSVCTADQIIAAEEECPSAPQPCRITLDYTISASDCVIDLSGSDVILTSTARIDVGDRQNVRLQFGTLRMERRSRIVGQGSAGNGQGASLTIATQGDLQLDEFAKVDLSASRFAGRLLMEVGGDAVIDGRIEADGASAAAAGGEVRLRASGSGSIGGRLSARNGSRSFLPGAVELSAAGMVSVAGVLDASGGDGGIVDVNSDQAVLIDGDIAVNARGTGGAGGRIEIFGLRGVVVNGDLDAKGRQGRLRQGGGYGGQVTVEAPEGGIDVAGDVVATGSGPNGSGGAIAIASGASVRLSPDPNLFVRTTASLGHGGTVSVEAAMDAQLSGTISASGGLEGGEVQIIAGRHLTLATFIDVRGVRPGAYGGSAYIDGGVQTGGDLRIGGIIDLSGGGCDPARGCGAGGLLSVVGCSVTLEPGTSLLARGGDGGDLFLRTRGNLTVGALAVIDTTTSTKPIQGSDGATTIEHPIALSPNLASTAAIVPAAILSPLALTPCPTCGNGVIESPEETCDDGNTLSCDGCSYACQIDACP